MATRLGCETNKKTQIGLSCDVELWPRAGAKRRNCEQQRTDKEMPRCMVVLAAEGTERQCSRVLDKKKPDAWEHLFLAAMRMEMHWCENDVSIPTGCTCRPLRYYLKYRLCRNIWQSWQCPSSSAGAGASDRDSGCQGIDPGQALIVPSLAHDVDPSTRRFCSPRYSYI